MKGVEGEGWLVGELDGWSGANGHDLGVSKKWEIEVDFVTCFFVGDGHEACGERFLEADGEGGGV